MRLVKPEEPELQEQWETGIETLRALEAMAESLCTGTMSSMITMDDGQVSIRLSAPMFEPKVSLLSRLQDVYY